MIVPQPEMYDFGKFGVGIKRWAEALTAALSRSESQGVLQLTAYAVARLPNPATAKWCLVIVKDEVGGEVPAWSDGTDWRRVTDRAIVS